MQGGYNGNGGRPPYPHGGHAGMGMNPNSMPFTPMQHGQMQPMQPGMGVMGGPYGMPNQPYGMPNQPYGGPYQAGPYGGGPPAAQPYRQQHQQQVAPAPPTDEEQAWLEAQMQAAAPPPADPAPLPEEDDEPPTPSSAAAAPPESCDYTDVMKMSEENRRKNEAKRAAQSARNAEIIAAFEQRQGGT